MRAMEGGRGVMTDTATATRVALAVAAPQSPAEELFGAGVQVREADPELMRRWRELVAECLAIPPHVWRAQTYGSFALSISLPVGQVAHPAYHPEHWRGVYDWRASAACCTPSRRPMTGGGYDGMRYVPLGSGEEGGK